MVLVRILKRKDASSIVLAIVIGSVLLQFIESITNKWAIKISRVNYGPVPYHWKEELLMPAVWLVLELLVLEVLCWIWVWGMSAMNRK